MSDDCNEIVLLYEEILGWTSDRRRQALRVAAADYLDLEARHQRGEDVEHALQGLKMWRAILETAEEAKNDQKNWC